VRRARVHQRPRVHDVQRVKGGRLSLARRASRTQDPRPKKKEKKEKSTNKSARHTLLVFARLAIHVPRARGAEPNTSLPTSASRSLGHLLSFMFFHRKIMSSYTDVVRPTQTASIFTESHPGQKLFQHQKLCPPCSVLSYMSALRSNLLRTVAPVHIVPRQKTSQTQPRCKEGRAVGADVPGTSGCQRADAGVIVAAVGTVRKSRGFRLSRRSRPHDLAGEWRLCINQLQE
jgi:hypothetical protein